MDPIPEHPILETEAGGFTHEEDEEIKADSLSENPETGQSERAPPTPPVVLQKVKEDRVLPPTAAGIVESESIGKGTSDGTGGTGGTGVVVTTSHSDDLEPTKMSLEQVGQVLDVS